MAATLGRLGMVGTLIAYVLVARGRLGAQSFPYACLNAIGGVLGAVASTMYGAWPSVAANVVWAVTAVHALSQGVAENHRQRRAESTAARPLELIGR